ncbi:hypothetical protein J2S54_000087 [Streptomyces sp. DSM 42143]|nr:hypothetical protein [Streptomyces sp. DSM 42143]
MAGTQVLPAVADACEELGVPCLSATFPWQASVHSRGADRGHAFRWTYHFAWGLDDITRLRPDVGTDRRPSHRRLPVGRRLQGTLLRYHEYGFAPVTSARGHTLAEPDRGQHRRQAHGGCPPHPLDPLAGPDVPAVAAHEAVGAALLRAGIQAGAGTARLPGQSPLPLRPGLAPQSPCRSTHAAAPGALRRSLAQTAPADLAAVGIEESPLLFTVERIPARADQPDDSTPCAAPDDKPSPAEITAALKSHPRGRGDDSPHGTVKDRDLELLLRARVPYCRQSLADDPHLWASSLIDEAVGLGYEGAYSTFTRALRRYRVRPHCESCHASTGRNVAVIAYPPG